MPRSGTSTEEYFGLGLHLVKEVAELHYGRFWIEGQSDQALRLIITLPSAEPQVT